ncbi:MAG: RsfA family transcriptional regulator [Bacillaceae bacterium]
MLKSRQDAWSEENDLLLAETVLRHVREGSTQLNAFEEVGDILNRTSAACGFRWNAVVRHNYEKALQLSRKYRKEQQRAKQGGNNKKKLLYNPPTTLLITEETQIERPAEPTESIEMVESTFIMPEPKTAITLTQVISYLQSLRDTDYQSATLQVENSKLRIENDGYRQQIMDLEQQIKELEVQTSTVQEDYETLINIMNRARKMVLFDEENANATSFRMDRNGNLERIAE